MGEHRRVGVGAGGEDLGLVARCGVQPGDLTAGEAAPTGVIGSAHRPVRQPVLLGPAEVVNEAVQARRAAGLEGERRLAIREDLEAVTDDLGEARLAPPASVKADGGPAPWAHYLARPGRHPAQLGDERRSRGGREHHQPVTVGVGHPGVELGGHRQADAGHVGLGDVG